MRQAIHPFRTWQARAWQAMPAKLRSNHRLFTLALLLTAVALIGIAVGLRGARAQSGPNPTSSPTPDYSKVGNALAGVTHLMRQDDLIVNMGQYTSANNTVFYPSHISAFTTANSSGCE